MPDERQVAVAAARFPSIYEQFKGYPNGFDPLNDHNIIHEMKKFLTTDEMIEAYSLVGAWMGAYYLAAFAPAQLWLEAILRVSKLWEESQ